jgi:hypothetical protein
VRERSDGKQRGYATALTRDVRERSDGKQRGYATALTREERERSDGKLTKLPPINAYRLSYKG